MKKGETLDDKEMSLMEAERVRWREVLTRLTAIVQSLALRDLALRGHTEALYTPSNGNFLKEVELLAKFDPVLKEHVARVQNDSIRHTSYLGKEVQNELIELLAKNCLSIMVDEIKQAKFFSVILDCTPDVSHTEQLSVVIRIVALEPEPHITEHFLGFLEAEESTGQNLASMILNRLEELNISFKDCRGQSYDNGANMRGKNKGVQARLLELNPLALFVPCGAHTLNLVVADAAKGSLDATAYFGYLQKLYNLFSSSTKRWAILKKHVTITLKMWSDTRWESKVKSVEPLRYQAEKVRDALLEVRDQTNDSVTKTEAQSLSEEVGSYRFSICTVVWFDILSKIQLVSKLMQSPKMQVDVTVNLLRKTQRELQDYRATGFVGAQTSAKELCESMNVEAVLKQRRLRSIKRQFSYETPDEPLDDAMRKLEVSFFNVVLDNANTAIMERFETLENVGEKFRVLSTFTTLSNAELTEQCAALSSTLQCDEHADIDGTQLAHELRSLPDLPCQKITQLELLQFIHENELAEIYPNLWTALRVALTLPVTVASAERSFSRLKLIKTYLRSTMSQERLSGLAVISINRQLAEKISYDDIIDDFASRKARRVRL
ncbi:zinc finger MYM-type protein 1-like [Diretmus argenteus]